MNTKIEACSGLLTSSNHFLFSIGFRNGEQSIDTFLALLIGYWLLVIGYWLLVIGYWLLVIGYWLLVIGYWLLVILNKRPLAKVKTASI